MPFPDDTSLGDILGDQPGFREIINRFTTEGVTSTPFAEGTQHSGTLKSLQTEPIDLGWGELALPGITTGIPFRLAIFDSPVGKWHLDLVLDGLNLKLHGLHGADFVKEAGTTPRRLIRKQTDTAVVISGEATLRFARASESDPVVLLFVENRSATDPLATTGAVVNLRCNPPHFFFGSSQFGMTLTEHLFDASSTFSPQFVRNQGQGADWVGFAVAEATFYAPPDALRRGGFSGGVRNLLLGSPRGIQGELELQWGRTPLPSNTFYFTQDGHTSVPATGSGNSLKVAITAGHDDIVQMTAGFTPSVPPEGSTTINDWQVTWRWPDGSETTGNTSTGWVGHGQVLRVTPEEHVAGRPVIRHPEISFRFVALGEVPQIDVISAGTTITNVIHVAGPKAGIEALQFDARSTAPSPDKFAWKLGDGAEQTGTPITLPAAEITGDKFLILKETAGQKRQTRLRVQVIEGVDLLIGGENGVVTVAAPTEPLVPAAVEGTYDLTDFHAQGRYSLVLDTAQLNPETKQVDVPDGALAIVTIASADKTTSGNHSSKDDRHVQIVFDFNKGTAIGWPQPPQSKSEDNGWRKVRPAHAEDGGSAADLHRQLLQWASNYSDARFLIIGRCDDLGTNERNATLAHDRRDTALRFLTTAPSGSPQRVIAPDRISGWGEQDSKPDDFVKSLPENLLSDEEIAAQRLILATNDVTGAALTDRTGWPLTHDTKDIAETTRIQFRRADIYAIGGTPTPKEATETEELSPSRAPDLRRVMIPGKTIDPVPADTSTPEMDYRVKLLVGWDKPIGEGWKDLIPSKAEFEFAWTPQEHPLPPLNGQSVDLGTEVLTIYGSWSHQDATGFTRSQLGIRSDGDPNGLFPPLKQKNLVATLALGPVLLSGVNSQKGTIEKAGRISALAAGAGFASLLLKDGSQATVKKIEATAEIGNLTQPGDAYKVMLTHDYSTVLHVDTGVLGLSTDPDYPVKFRYKDVTIHFDSTQKNFWDKIGLAYPTDSISIEDPGKWKIDGVLGQLLRAVETALGTGSLWIETRFAFALTIGVVEISEAVIRVTFTPNTTPIPDIDFSLRGLVAKIDIPKTVKGEGRLRIEDRGVIKAGVDLELIPLKLKASAAFAMAHMDGDDPYTYVYLFVKVQFPVGIPLGASGAAIHGFLGQTAINGTRNLGLKPSDDIVTREIDWWSKRPEDKYTQWKDQHALGVGVVVGTLPDASFCLSATGMLVVAFPDPEVILGVEVNILSVPDKTAKDKKEEGQNASITGLIVIDDTAVSMAVSARYTIPKVLEVKAPIAAYFPYSPHGVYVRIGADGQMGRSGEPVTLTLLPSTINLQAFSYLMIEQDGLHNLGGNPAFSFDGFSVGFGAGAGIEWKAEPIRLSASILLLAGFGTDPLFIKAGIFVKGELDLVVVSVSARGEIVLTYLNDNISLDGEFCGKVDLFLFSVEGCAKFHIGTPPVLVPPPPEPPVASVVLTDRGNRIMGEALAGDGVLQAHPIFRMTEVGGKMQNTGKDPKDNNTVWADTAPVINFRHYIEDADAAGGQFQRAGQPSGERWFGSNRLKYTYRLDGVRLIRVSNGALVTGANPLKSVWETSPARQPGSAGPQQPSGAEVQSLRLLDWQPWGWALPMADGGASAPGDPVELIRKLCDPIPEPAHACLYGQDARGAGVDRIRLLHETPPPGPYPSRFTLTGRSVLKLGGTDILIEGEVLNAQIAQLGGMVIPGAVKDLPQPVPGPGGKLTRSYHLPEVQIATTDQVSRTALPWLADFDRTIRRGHLLLMVCDGRTQRLEDEPRLCYDFTGLSIGKEYVTLDVPGFTFEALGPASPFIVTDQVDRSQGNPTLGADSRPDIRITLPGMTIRPHQPSRIIELHLYRDEIVPTEVEWTDNTGKSYGLTEPGGKKGSAVLRLEANADIVKITIASRAEALYLYQICKIGADQAQDCFNFDGLRPDDVQSGDFSHAGVTFKSLNPDFGFRLLDWVDARATPAQRGKDANSELSFPDKGVELTPAQPWSSVSIGVFSSGGPITALAFDANENLIANVQDPARDPVDLHLAVPGIARIVLTGGANEAVIFRICHGSNFVGEICTDFRGTDAQTAEKLVLSDMILTPAEPGQLLELMDVLTESNPIIAQADGRPELLVPSGGLILTPAAPLARAVLYIVTFAGEMIEAVGLDSNGNKVASASGGGAVDTLNRLTLESAGITQIMLRVSRECFLTRICTLTEDYLPGLPRIFTRENRVQILWTPQVVSTIPADNGGICRIVRYDQPATLIDASSFEVETPVGNRTTLLTFCGVDSRADLAQNQDREAQRDLKEVVTNAAAEESGVNMREILLDPGQDYRIEIDWSWQAWTSNEKGTNSPPALPLDSAWIKGEQQNFVFRVASEDLIADETQDGLNEYKFDPRDIARYLSRTEPADGRDVVFTDDPLWVHFNSGHVEALIDRYGRRLDLWVRRTDPPPQPDAAMETEIFPILLETIRLKGPHYTQTLAEQRINAAIIGAICLPDEPAVSGSGISIGARFQLEPNAMYDFNLIAPKKGMESPDPVIVNATRFKTSRYANPSEMMAALGFSSTEVAPIAPQEIILSEGVVLPSGPLSVSDLDMGVALASVGADTLPLPGDEPRVIALWLHLGDGDYRVAGILIDSPEPMRRQRAVIQGQQAVDSIRCEPELIALKDASFLPVRATLNWTRVLFVSDAPVTPTDEAVMSLNFKVPPDDVFAPGGILTGQRIIYARPLMLDTEGF